MVEGKKPPSDRPLIVCNSVDKRVYMI